MSDINPLEGHERVCHEICPLGWVYCGEDDGEYIFQRGEYGQEGFAQLVALEIDLKRATLELMVREGWSR